MTTKKSEADALGAILDKLGAMEYKIDALEDRIDEASKPPPLTVNKDNPYQNKTVITDTIYPNAPSLFNKGDVVRINKETELVGLIMERGSKDIVDKIKASEEVLATVEEYAATHPRTGEPRFFVNIPGVGKEQVYYKDLELVSSNRG